MGWGQRGDRPLPRSQAAETHLRPGLGLGIVPLPEHGSIAQDVHPMLGTRQQDVDSVLGPQEAYGAMPARMLPRQLLKAIKGYLVTQDSHVHKPSPVNCIHSCQLYALFATE